MDMCAGSQLGFTVTGVLFVHPPARPLACLSILPFLPWVLPQVAASQVGGQDSPRAFPSQGGSGWKMGSCPLLPGEPHIPWPLTKRCSGLSSAGPGNSISISIREAPCMMVAALATGSPPPIFSPWGTTQLMVALIRGGPGKEGRCQRR